MLEAVEAGQQVDAAKVALPVDPEEAARVARLMEEDALVARLTGEDAPVARPTRRARHSRT